VQPAYAQETQHGSTETHSGSNTSTSGQTNDHSAQNSEQHPSDTGGHGADNGASNDGLMSEGHDATEGHAPAGSEDAIEKHEPLKTESHPASSHNAEHGGGEAGHGGSHTGYHPPAPYVITVADKFSVHLNTLLATWMVMAFLIVMAVAATRKLTKKPSTKQIFYESLVDLPHYVVKSQITHNTARYVPLIGTIFLFSLGANWLGLLPWRIIEFFTPAGFEMAAPTNDLNTNGAIALTAVAAYWFFGISKNGLSHFKHYFQPMWFLFPLNMMEDVSRPLSLSFRLFGNILGGEIVIGILLFLTSAYVVTSVVVLPMFLLEVLVGFIQAFIFSMLTASYIGAMVSEHH
jgi:F-type H+-transporting ATPase subunit a